MTMTAELSEPIASHNLAASRGFKATEIGIFPSDWTIVELGKIGEFKNGINKDIAAFGHGSPFVNLMDVFGVPLINSTNHLGLIASTPAERKSYDLRAGDVLFVRSSVKPSGVALTTTVLADLPEAVFSGFLIRFRDNGVIATDYKRHCFDSDYFRKAAIAASTVSANTNISQSALKKLKLAIPATWREQEAIAEVLSEADEHIRRLEQLIEKKALIKIGAVQDLLSGRRRLPGFSREWVQKRLGDGGTFFKGSGIRRDQAQSGDLPCIRYGELYTHHNDLIRQFYSRVSGEVAATAQRVLRGDILFAGSGETKEEIGKCAVLDAADEAHTGGDVIVFRPREDDPIFLGYYLNSASVQSQKAAKGQGDAVVHISSRALADLDLVLPERDEQTAIAQVLLEMDAELDALELRLEKARQIKQGMMQELLTGRVRLV